MSALIPIVLMVAAVAALAMLEVPGTFGPPFVLPLLHTVLISFVSIAGVVVAARSFRLTGSWPSIMIGAGLMSFALANLAGGWLTGWLGANVGMTAHNAESLLTSALFAAGGWISLRGPRRCPDGARLPTVLLLAAAIAASEAVLVLLGLGGGLPPFYLAVLGPTAVRQHVVGASAGLFLLAAALNLLYNRRAKSRYLRWHVLGLVLLATAFVALLFGIIVGDALAWLARIAEYLASAYFLFGLLAARSEAKASGADVTETVARLFREPGASYGLLADISLDALVCVGPDGRILLWNPAARAMFGYSVGEALRLPVEQLFAPAHVEPFRRAVQDLLGASREGDPATAPPPASRPEEELLARRKGGEVFPAIISLSARKTRAGLVTLLFVRDASQRRKAEDRIIRQNAILEAVNGILTGALACETTEALGRVCLEIAERLTGSAFGFIGLLNSNGTLDGVAVSDPGWEACRMQPTGTPRGVLHDMTVHGIYGRTVLEGRAFFTNDPARHPDRVGTPHGHPELTAFLGVPLARSDRTIGMIGLGNRPGGYRTEDQEAGEALAPAIVMALDRKQAEQGLRERTGELETANRELESFSYSVSHDLRAPLRIMDGYSKALLEDYAGSLDERGRRWLESIRQSSHTMGQLISDILTLSRVARAEIRLERVDLSALARSTAERLRAAEPGRRIELAIAPGIEARGDGSLLALVLENLVGNAFKFTSRREEAQIEFGAGERGGRQVFWVRDNGVGFDMQYADRLFMPFQRLHSDQDFPGTGVGLVTVQRIVGRHGGTVWAEGATFSFTLEPGAGS